MVVLECGSDILSMFLVETILHCYIERGKLLLTVATMPPKWFFWQRNLMQMVYWHSIKVVLQMRSFGSHYTYMHSRKPKNRGHRKKRLLLKKTLSGSQ